ncbi:TPA: hypothetical protein ACIIU4_004354 [Citrobacter freundii]|uniref:hypothetical protein n=1 Tax=Citrobacter freundii TaxID=546 RepID=UPI0008FD8278|nr:hypothetical protein [Citrobacter freundii]MDU1753100.1 hypothetical protein [Citrobacter sp.]MDU4810201.1 hypothetical protein [Citrobacter freundii]OIZ38326.1 hypothetical protein BEH71_20550 [Citrobacter freundii]
MKGLFSALIMCIALTGCVQPMTKAEVDRAVYEPLPADYQEQIKSTIELKLKDPDSAKYRFFDPKKGYTEGTRHFGFVVPVGVNAKNSYGGYTGYKLYYFVYYNQSFKDVTEGVAWDAVKWSDDVK